jgi:hypothetical protein
LKIFSLPTFALNSHNNIFMPYQGN